MTVAGLSVVLTDGLTEKLILVYYHGFNKGVFKEGFVLSTIKKN